MAEPAIPLPIEDPRKELERIERNLRYLKARRESLIGRLPAEGVHIPEEEQAIRESQLDELSTVENEIDVLSNKKLEIGQAIGFTEEGVLKPKVVDGTTYPPTMEDLVTHVRQSDRDTILKKATGRKMGGYIKKYANGGGVRKVRE